MNMLGRLARHPMAELAGCQEAVESPVVRLFQRPRLQLARLYYGKKPQSSEKRDQYIADSQSILRFPATKKRQDIGTQMLQGVSALEQDSRWCAW